jgi:hypothetical protein
VTTDGCTCCRDQETQSEGDEGGLRAESLSDGTANRQADGLDAEGEQPKDAVETALSSSGVAATRYATPTTM